MGKVIGKRLAYSDARSVQGVVGTLRRGYRIQIGEVPQE